MKWIFLCSTLFAHAKPIKISLDWLLSPHHIPLILAKQLGFFKKEGLDVSLIASVGSSESCRLVAAGKLDYAITHEPKVKEMAEKNVNLKIIFKLIPHSLSVFVSHYPITALKGKKIGHASQNAGFAIDHIMKKYHYKKDDITLLYVKTAFVSSFMTHHVDAISGMWNIYEGELISKHCPNAYFYPYTSLGIPDFSDVVIVKAEANQWPDEAFKRALQKAVDFIKAHPAQAFDLAVKHYPELNTAFNKKTWYRFVPLFSSEK